MCLEYWKSIFRGKTERKRVCRIKACMIRLCTTRHRPSLDMRINKITHTHNYSKEKKKVPPTPPSTLWGNFFDNQPSYNQEHTQTPSVPCDHIVQVTPSQEHRNSNRIPEVVNKYQQVCGYMPGSTKATLPGYQHAGLAIGQPIPEN